MKKILLLPILIGFLASCSNSVDLAIDNPTSVPVTLYVDTLYVQVPPEDVVWVEMGRGNHTIKLANGEETKFDFTEEVYMINPTKREYLSVKEYYGAKPPVIPEKKVTFMGVEMEGDYSVYKDVILPVTWDYGPREELPETVEADEDETYVFLEKLYSEGEFYAKVVSQLQQEGSETTQESTVAAPSK